MDRGRDERIDHRCGTGSNRGAGVAEIEERLGAASRRLLERTRVAQVELYHRLSRTIRVTHELDGADEHVSRRSGVDEGTALRLWRPSEQGVRFTAVSGSTEAAIVDAAARALGGACAEAPHELGFGGERLDDHDDVPLPDEAVLARWLAAAREGLGRRVARTWVEAAETRETWVVGGDVRASRSRVRGWAAVELAASGSNNGAPLILASRAWNRLDTDGWARLAESRLEGRSGTHPPAPDDVPPLLLAPESAATLILTLVRAAAAMGPELAVSPGFRITDAPDEPEALFGGGFDDLGFRTARQPVADGRSLAAPSGPGHYRRPSFRDTPVALPSNLVVAPPASTPPGDRWSIHRLAIHALSVERWGLEVDATLYRGHEPCGSLRGAHVATGPRELLARCIVGVGAPVASHRGVVTPALLFEGFSVRP